MEIDERKIRLALGILSGRFQDLDADDLEILGYNTYSFSYYGRPDKDDLKAKAEDIIYYALSMGMK